MFIILFVQERPDEAEIREMAAKMSEQHKQQMAKIQQASQRVTPAQNAQNPPIGGQTNILNYLTRSQKPNPVNSIVGQQQQPSSSKSSDVNETAETDKKDEESQKGHFGKSLIKLSNKIKNY